ncbi:Transcription factor FAMA [Apostasia shenzhenica]|uniref:Transcription factor FAMA n=1 Tax=Apostasia shenzhenica TaxID=1088818 RepID=A0A2I0B0I2_9ASPA|nr:Transcription factor FAMA [Apostasia shenzhenica]
MDQKEVEDDYSRSFESAGGGSGDSLEMVDYMLNTPPSAQPQNNGLDRLSFADVMQFADVYRPKAGKLAGDQEENLNCFFKFPSLLSPPPPPPLAPPPPPPQQQIVAGERTPQLQELEVEEEEEEEPRFSENTASSVQQMGMGGGGGGGGDGQVVEGKSRRKRTRSMKTSEEVESQRMTHIAVERNRRRQMNEHLRVLRSLMPSSYVQRGDQASIIGGAIEFVRELEQLLQCLESQKRRRLYGGGEAQPRAIAGDPTLPLAMQQPHQSPPPPFFPALPLPGGASAAAGGLDIAGETAGVREDSAENKSCLADIEVRLLGADGLIKILSRRRPGQLLKTIAALEDMQFSILHTNITTIEQTVLYSFNVKITGEITACSAEEIANTVQQILSFIDSSTI